ncbi:hypothetical protein ACFQY5_25220 [Paeniroseomonas aquatica]
MAQVLMADPQVSARLSAAEVARLTDPSAYLGSTQAFIDRVLARLG